MSHHVWRGRLQSPLYSLCLVGLRDDWGEHDLKKRFLNFFLLENEFGVMTICRTACKQPQVPAPLFTAAWRVLNSTELGVPPSNIFFTSLLVSFGEHNSLVHPHQCVSVLFFDWSKQLDLSGKKEKKPQKSILHHLLRTKQHKRKNSDYVVENLATVCATQCSEQCCNFYTTEPKQPLSRMHCDWPV